MVHEKHKIPIYHNILNLVYDKEIEIPDMLDKLGIEEEDIDGEDADGLSFIQDNEYWICLHNNLTPGIIAHEAKHYVNYVWEQISAKLNQEEDEFEAYFLGYVVDLIHKFIKENKIELKENEYIWYQPIRKIIK